MPRIGEVLGEYECPKCGCIFQDVWTPNGITQKILKKKDGVAQGDERTAEDRKVVGSNPTPVKKKKGL